MAKLFADVEIYLRCETVLRRPVDANETQDDADEGDATAKEKWEGNSWENAASGFW